MNQFLITASRGLSVAAIIKTTRKEKTLLKSTQTWQDLSQSMKMRWETVPEEASKYRNSYSNHFHQSTPIHLAILKSSISHWLLQLLLKTMAMRIKRSRYLKALISMNRLSNKECCFPRIARTTGESSKVSSGWNLLHRGIMSIKDLILVHTLETMFNPCKMIIETLQATSQHCRPLDFQLKHPTSIIKQILNQQWTQRKKTTSLLRGL